MNPCGIDSVHRNHPRQNIGYQCSGQLMDKGAKAGVLLGRAANRGEGPDRPGTMIDLFNGEDRKIVF